jgi:hypothetical protein
MMYSRYSARTFRRHRILFGNRINSDLCRPYALLMIVLLVWPSATRAASLRIVVQSNAPAPGIEANARFDDSYVVIPFINSLGYTAFPATLTNTSSPHATMWVENASGLSLIAREGIPAPATASGITLSDFNSGVIGFNTAGHAIFTSLIAIPGVSGSIDGYGLWGTTSSGLSKYVRLTDAAPGLPAGVTITGAIGQFEVAGFNDADQVAFLSSLSGTGVTSTNNSAIWLGSLASGLQLIARTGSPAPGTTGNFEHLGDPALNNVGGAAYFGWATTAGLYGVWARSNSGTRLVAIQNLPAPGTSAGIAFSQLRGPTINNSNQTAFFSTLKGSGVTSLNENSVWSEGNGGLHMVARSGDQAPGAPPGVNFVSFGAPTQVTPILNGAGNVAFIAGLDGSGVSSANGDGIWYEKQGSGLTMLAREGDPAAGFTDGTIFTDFSSVFFNKAGQIAFRADLSKDGQSIGNGIWATDLAGQLQLIANTGELVEMSPGVFRQIQTVYFGRDYGIGSSGNEDGRVTEFNDRGQLAFGASFIQHSGWGAFVYDSTGVPEPASSALGAIMGCILFVRRKNPR